MYNITTSTHSQRGAALIVALSILLVLTILGVSAMSTTALQERMAGNARDADVAFEAAEAALRTAENSLSTPLNFAANANGLYDATTPDVWKDSTKWATAISTTYSLTTNSPQYIIQVTNSNISAAGTVTSLEPINYTNNPPPIGGGVTIYQITARGYGLSANSRVMLQSYYGQ